MHLAGPSDVLMVPVLLPPTQPRPRTPGPLMNLNEPHPISFLRKHQQALLREGFACPIRSSVSKIVPSPVTLCHRMARQTRDVCVQDEKKALTEKDIREDMSRSREEE